VATAEAAEEELFGREFGGSVINDWKLHDLSRHASVQLRFVDPALALAWTMPTYY